MAPIPIPKRQYVQCRQDASAVFYRGSLSVTLSGYTCQPWTRQFPHAHRMIPRLYPDAGLGNHNYCRNPDGMVTAWCYTANPLKRWEFCALGIFHPDCVISKSAPEECYTQSNAADYRGRVSRTRDGSSCQKWTKQCPNEHEFTPDNYPDSGLGDHNFCRNPGGSAQHAWCYTNRNGYPGWGYCYIGPPQEKCTPAVDNVTTPLMIISSTPGVPECRSDKAAVNYRGNLSVTISGFRCQPWTRQYPHRHRMSPFSYPQAGLGRHNYCRNPGSYWSQLVTAWCYTTNPLKRWDYCALGVFHPACAISNDDKECYTETNAVDYRGEVAVTGRYDTPCQKWTSQSPNEHDYTPDNYTDSGLGSHNFCRNPGGEADFAWCFVASNYTRWRYCNIGPPRDNCTFAEETSTRAATTESPCEPNAGGSDYRGMASTTVSGRTCQRWTVQQPHQHNRTPGRYPLSGLGNHSYCRNVGGTAATAWCYTTDPQSRWEYCPVGLFAPNCRLTSDPGDCYSMPSGTDYRGFINTTVSGLLCQSWTSQVPHSHSRTPYDYPDAGLGDHNFCRNPDQSNFAWCYTTDADVRWEHCNIGIPQDQCSDEASTPTTATPSSPPDSAIIRLVGGNSSSEGRVEVNRDGIWGTVCDSGWGLEEATVVCRMLGYSRAKSAPGRAHFGPGMGLIALDDVSCSGTESDIFACEKKLVHNCLHSDDAGVVCTDEP